MLINPKYLTHSSRNLLINHHKVCVEFHIKIHPEKKPFTLNIQHWTLKDHMRVHTVHLPTVWKDFNRHKRVHAREKPYTYQQCGKCFCQRWTMKVHMRVHTREKPFTCLYNMKNVSPSGKTYTCQHCESFAQHWNLPHELHMRIHTEESLLSYRLLPKLNY